jgi:hypothetical protein
METRASATPEDLLKSLPYVYTRVKETLPRLFARVSSIFILMSTTGAIRGWLITGNDLVSFLLTLMIRWRYRNM